MRDQRSRDAASARPLGGDQVGVAEPADWLAGFARALGVDPLDQTTIDTVLELASVAAHASQRWAAPVAAYLAGKSGVDPSHALRAAEQQSAAGGPPA